MAHLITPTKTIEYNPGNGKEFTLEEMQKAVDGYIEIVQGKNFLFIVNEEGKLRGLPMNMAASFVATEDRAIFNDILFGNVIVCKISDGEVK